MTNRRMLGCQMAAAVALLGVLAVVAAIVWGIVTMIGQVRQPGKVASFARMLSEWETVRSAWAGVVEEVDKEPKLVVLQTSITVFVSRRSEKRLFWELLDLGDTVVELRAEDNRVQYVVPLGDFGPEDVDYDAERRILTVYLPAPELDREMIAVQSDPDKLHLRTQVGWGRLRRGSGRELEREVRDALRRVVIRYGRSEHLRDSARVNAETVLRERVFAPLATALAERDVELRLEFRD